MKIGDKVRVIRTPADLPKDNKQLVTLFRGCVGKTFPIVSEAFGKPAEYHQIWLEPSHVSLVEG